MKKYTITIVETLCRDITVDADNTMDAIDKVRDMYYNEEIVLDASDHFDTEFFDYQPTEN